MREYIDLLETVQTAVSNVPIDDLPQSAKNDILDMLICRDTGFQPAYIARYGINALDDEYVRGEIFGLAEPQFQVNILTLAPDDIRNVNRSVSDMVVSKYKDLQTTPPPILVRKDGDGWQIVEGGHRLAAAKAKGVPAIPAIDVTPFYETNWEEYLDG